MSEQRSGDGRSVGRRSYLAAAGSAAALGLAGCTGGEATGTAGGTGTGTTGSGTTPVGGTTGGADDGASGPMTVFHAGSLAPPFGEVETGVEEAVGVRVNREAQGSVGSTRKITDQGRSADVLGVSDYRLIRDMMVGEYAAWYGVFVTNAMAVAYTDDSAYADEIAEGNWWEVLSREDVDVAHSDPAVDPNGYRSVMAMRLGAVEFRGERLYDESTARALQDNAEVTADTETDLVGQLESGALDYAWGYRSAGAAHDGLDLQPLQPHVDLSKATPEYADHYANAAVTAGGNTYTGAPIAYGITVPSVAEHPDAGARFVEYVTRGDGADTMTGHGFTAVSPMRVPTSAESAVPSGVMEGATARETLGPLDL